MIGIYFFFKIKLIIIHAPLEMSVYDNIIVMMYSQTSRLNFFLSNSRNSLPTVFTKFDLYCVDAVTV